MRVMARTHIYIDPDTRFLIEEHRQQELVAAIIVLRKCQAEPFVFDVDDGLRSGEIQIGEGGRLAFRSANEAHMIRALVRAMVGDAHG